MKPFQEVVAASATSPSFSDRSLPSNVAKLARELASEDPSGLLVFLFDAERRLIAFAELPSAPLEQPLGLVRDVFRVAIAQGAHAIAVAHNHASGSIAPGAADHDATRVAYQAGEVLGIPMLDHVIVASGSEEYYSFRQMGWLPQPAPTSRARSRG